MGSSVCAPCACIYPLIFEKGCCETLQKYLNTLVGMLTGSVLQKQELVVVPIVPEKKKKKTITADVPYDC